MKIREERDGDRDAVDRVNREAFGQPDEANLVQALHRAGVVSLSLVAEDDQGGVVGHILFSPVRITAADGSEHGAIGLAPMAVAPGLQKGGIGSSLVRAGLEHLRDAGHRAVVVLGHPEYYPRFGFRPASSWGIRWEHEAPDEAFMALELEPGALAGTSGVVRFHDAFDGV